MNIASHMGLRKMLWNQAREIIGLAGGAGNLQHFRRWRIGYIGVIAAGFDQNILNGVHQLRFSVPNPAPFGTVKDIGLSGFSMTSLNQDLFHHVLDILERSHVNKRKVMRFGSFGWSGGAQKQFDPFVQALGWDCLGVVEYQGAPKDLHTAKAVELAAQLAKAVKVQAQQDGE